MHIFPWSLFKFLPYPIVWELGLAGSTLFGNVDFMIHPLTINTMLIVNYYSLGGVPYTKYDM